MIRKRLFAPLLAAAIGVCSAFGQDAFDQTIATIAKSNPQIEVERDIARAVALDNADANSLANPEVSFSRVWGARDVGNKLQLDISQSFDWPGLYGARRKANDRQQSAAQLLCQWTELEVSLQAKRLLIELVYVKKQMSMIDELLLSIQQLEQALDTALDQGYATELDRRKVAIEKYKLTSQAAAIASRRAQIEGELQSMCPGEALDLSAIDAYPIEHILTLDEYMEQIAALDPQIAAAAMTEEAAAYDTKAASMRRFPGFSVGYQHQAEIGDRFNGFTLSMSLPFFENRRARSAARARTEAASRQTTALIAEKQAAVAASMSEMATWRDCVDNYNVVFGDNAYLTLIKKAYDGGEFSLLEYISETQYYAEATQTFLEAEYNFRTALVELNKYNLIRRQ